MPTFTRNGFSMHHEAHGAGEPAVLVGGMSADLQAWRFQARELSASFRVVVFDNRGAGRTDAPDEPFMVAQMADDLDALLGHLGVGRAAVVGWSMGGLIAQTLARANPGRVAWLVPLGTFVAPDGHLRAEVSERRSSPDPGERSRIPARTPHAATPRGGAPASGA